MTGAPLPQGADAVVQSEVTEEARPGCSSSRPSSRAGISGRPARTSRRATGARPGQRARPGRDRTDRQPGISRRCRSTGGRAWPSSPPAANWWRSTGRWLPGQIHNSNSYSLASSVPAAGHRARPCSGIVTDDYEATKRAHGGGAGVRRAAHLGWGLGGPVRLRQRRAGRTWASSGGCGAWP